MEKFSEDFMTMLEDHRFFVRDDLLDKTDLNILYQEALRRHNLKFFEPAKIGRGANQQREINVRGDWTSWIEEDEPNKSIQKYLQIIGELTDQINKTFFAGLKRFECHFSFYPAGTYYKKHVDQFQGHTARQLSCILYLNLDYKKEDSGELVIYSPLDTKKELIRVPPLGGRFVCFLTKDLHHEVLLCQKDRFALTGWVRND